MGKSQAVQAGTEVVRLAAELAPAKEEADGARMPRAGPLPGGHAVDLVRDQGDTCAPEWRQRYSPE